MIERRKAEYSWMEVFSKRMKFTLKDEYITLQQILKACDVIQSGGQIKSWLAENEVLVNGEPENRRGKKLRSGDVVEAGGIRIEIE